MDAASAATHFANIRRALMGLPDRSSLLSLDAIEREWRAMRRELDDTKRVDLPDGASRDRSNRR